MTTRRIPAPNRCYQRDPLPDLAALRAFIGDGQAVARFDRLMEHLAENYDFEPQIVWGGVSFGVMVRYRRGGRTLVSLFPERGGMSVVLVYGRKEQEAFEAARDGLAPGLTALFDTAQVYPDGRWLLIPVDSETPLPDIGRMIAIKKKPGRKQADGLDGRRDGMQTRPRNKRAR